MKRSPDLVFLTGAGSGIGRATALRFANSGATVVVTDVNLDTAEETAELVRADGGNAASYRLDVADAAAFEALAELVQVNHGVPDVVVNNAGMVIAGTFLEHSVADWERTLNIHLMGVVHGSRLFGAQMVERGKGGHIVNLSSVGGFVPFQMGPAYCTAKAAIRMLSECMSVELAPHGIGVTAICPGLIKTNIAADGDLLNALDGQVEALKDSAAVGMDSLGSPPDKVARAIERSVRYNWTVTPVRPEAWFGQAAMRMAPGLTMVGMAWMTRERAFSMMPVAQKALVRVRQLTGQGTGA